MLSQAQEISSQDGTMMLTAVPERLLPSGSDPDDGLLDPPRPERRLHRSPHSRSVWAQEVATAVAANRVRLRAIRSRTERPLPAAEADALHDGIESLLSRADRAARGVDPRYTPFVSWWRGNCIEAAFHNLHRAEAEMVRLYSDDEVDAEIPEAVARAEIGLNRSDPRRAAALKLLSMKDGAATRITLSKIVRVGHETTDRLHSRVRVFRNIVLVTALLLALFVSIFVGWVADHPDTVPLCFTTPDVTSCPTGQRQASSRDVQVVALLGLLGGALAAAVSIRNTKGTSTPYNVAIALALLKLPAGALTALSALIVIRGGLVPGFTALDTQPQVLAYVLLFGYAQQLLTGLIDKRALNLLDSVPSKNPAQDRTPVRQL
jgi:hypothetical protein